MCVSVHHVTHRAATRRTCSIHVREPHIPLPIQRALEVADVAALCAAAAGVVHLLVVEPSHLIG